MNDLTLLQTFYTTGAYLSYPAMKKVMNGVLKDKKVKVIIPDNILDLKIPIRGTLNSIIHKIVVALQYLWHRFKLLSKSYRLRFRSAVKMIIGAYDDRTKRIYILANRSINHQGKIQYLKKKIQETIALFQKKKDELQELLKAHKKQTKRHARVLENARELERLNQLSYFSKEYWSRTEKITNIFHEIEELDKSYFNGSDPAYFDPEDFEFYRERYSLESDNPIGTVKNIRDLQDRISTVEKEAEEIKEDIDKLDEAVPVEEEANRKVIEQLQKLTKCPEYIPLIDEEEEVLLGEVQKEATEENPRPKRSDDYLKMIKEVKHFTGCRDLSYLWVILLNNDDKLDLRIRSWRCDSKGRFSLAFTKPLNLWIDIPDRKGGCVFTLGNNSNRTIHGTLKESHIKIDGGFDSHTYQKIAMVNKKISPAMGGIIFDNPHCVRMPGTCLGITGENIDSFSTMKQTWKTRVTLIPEDYPGGYSAYLDKKFHEAR